MAMIREEAMGREDHAVLPQTRDNREGCCHCSFSNVECHCQIKHEESW